MNVFTLFSSRENSVFTGSLGALTWRAGLEESGDTALLVCLACSDVFTYFFPPHEEVFLGTTSPRIDFVGKEGGLTFFAGFCVDDEFV